MNDVGPRTRAHIRYFDTGQQCEAIKLLPNEYYVVTPNAQLMLTTVLGSCVAACMRDPLTGVGGMNHFMLPGDSASAPATMRYGSYAMEVLINEVLKAGAARSRLEAKVFGGGAVLSQMTTLAIGDSNADFVLAYLEREGIPVVAQDLRGKRARRVNYFPSTGKAMVHKIVDHSTEEADVARQESDLRSWLALSRRPTDRGVQRVHRFGPGAIRLKPDADRNGSSD